MLYERFHLLLQKFHEDIERGLAVALVLYTTQMRSWFSKLTMKVGFKLMSTKGHFISREHIRIIKQLIEL
jgi:hypothetical protein